MIVVVAFALIAVVWVWPIWVGHRIGARKGRAGWAWGFLLGWLGVLIVALLPSTDFGFTTDAQLRAEREYDALVDELRRRRAAQLQR